MTFMEPFPAPDPSHHSQGRGHSTWWWAGLIALIVSPVVVTGGGIILWFQVTGTPVIDEWQCSDGEAPYVYPQGGSACATKGSELPKGASWDPFGNRPLACHDRWHWVEVEAVTPNPDRDSTDCVAEGEPIPDGWRRVS